MSSIFALINDIEAGEIVLPAIQRDFVWGEERIEKLFDSLLRGYPVGIVLLWETYEHIQFRKFVKDYNRGDLYHYSENSKNTRLRLVLDGQQRLTAINIAIRGSLDGRRFYFDLLSGNEGSSEERYRFQFATAEQIEKVNATSNPASDQASRGDRSYWHSVPDLLGMTPVEAMKLRNNVSESLDLSDDEKLLLESNIHGIIHVFTSSSETLIAQTIDAKLPPQHATRKTVFDILEIFVRINRQGEPLSRSDLIVSMLRLYWPKVSDLLPKFIKTINDGSGLNIDTNFVIRCMFAVSGIGTRLDYDLLRRKSNVDGLKSSFSKCLDAIRSTVDFVRMECSTDSVKMLGGLNTLVPFVYFLHHQKTHTFGISNISGAKKALYLAAFSRVFSQHSDSRTGSFIRDYITPGDPAFPLRGMAEYVGWKAGFDTIDSKLVGSNIDLALSLIQNKSGGKIHHSKNLPEIDHIFPRAMVAERFDASLVNDLGNFWILRQLPNRNKSANHPKDFLADVSPQELERAFIDLDALDVRKFRSFVEARREKIVARVIKLTGLADTEIAAGLSGTDLEELAET